MDLLDTSESISLSYDENISYEEQLPTEAELREREKSSLAARIGTAKLYLLSETTRTPKRKRDEEEDAMEEEDAEMQDAALSYRPNAILISGSPISCLSTSRIFAYATHFDAHPLGLEWIDDITCILVFDSVQSAKAAQQRLQKSKDEEQDVEGFVIAKPIPLPVWPPEERINKTLGTSEGLKGVLKMRFATAEDVKKKGAKQASEFYQKYGETAGKEMYGEPNSDSAKRRRQDTTEEDALRRAQLDAELEDFLLADDKSREPTPPPSPPSKMRSDYIAPDGRTLLDRTSDIRLLSDSNTKLSERIQARAPRRRGRHLDFENDLRHGRGRKPVERGRRGNERPRKTQKELDEELEAFLNQQD